MGSQDRPARPSWPQRPFSRRGFLGGAAALSAGAMVGSRLPGVAHAAETGGLHGAQLRGMFLTSKDRLAEGRFGAMFKRLPAFAPPNDLLDSLAGTMVEDQTVPDNDHLNTSPRLFAGFTFIRTIHRPRHHPRHHPTRPAASRPRRARQLPHAVLWPRLALWTRAGPRSRLLRSGRPGQVPAERQYQ
jgi:hypothetical protein